MAEKSDDRLRGYIVTSTTLEGEDYRDCQVIPYGDPFPANRRQVFGPASEKECRQWAAKNCNKSASK
ncbi:MAG TPA: hypothetical protein VG148_03635 [Pyrinomonadaceae bacterium]|nr:hypothetical protein [Pyrinomonadaceae bacterium]